MSDMDDLIEADAEEVMSFVQTRSSFTRGTPEEAMDLLVAVRGQLVVEATALAESTGVDLPRCFW